MLVSSAEIKKRNIITGYHIIYFYKHEISCEWSGNLKWWHFSQTLHAGKPVLKCTFLYVFYAAVHIMFTVVKYTRVYKLLYRCYQSWKDENNLEIWRPVNHVEDNLIIALEREEKRHLKIRGKIFNVYVTYTYSLSAVWYYTRTCAQRSIIAIRAVAALWEHFHTAGIQTHDVYDGIPQARSI